MFWEALEGPLTALNPLGLLQHCKKKKLLLVRVRDLCFGSCVSWVMLQMPDGGGYLLVCGFLCSNAGIPSASQSPHASKSCSILCAHNVKAPQRCVQLQRDYKDMFALKGLCWLRNDCNRISINLHSALLIVWGFVSLLLSFSLSFSLFFFVKGCWPDLVWTWLISLTVKVSFISSTVFCFVFLLSFDFRSAANALPHTSK